MRTNHSPWLFFLGVPGALAFTPSSLRPLRLRVHPLFVFSWDTKRTQRDMKRTRKGHKKDLFGTRKGPEKDLFWTRFEPIKTNPIQP
jgi:hypothetical protein